MADARRALARLEIGGADVSAELGKYLIQLSYTDSETDEADDLQLVLDDRDGEWIGQWLSRASEETGSDPEQEEIRGSRISAAIVQRGWGGDGDWVLDCGVFQCDSASFDGPPAKTTIKAASMPLGAALAEEERSEAYEDATLKGIAQGIADRAGLALMYEAAENPAYGYRLQAGQTDIAFLRGLCADAGISLKVAAWAIVLFDQAAFEALPPAAAIRKGDGSYTSWSFSTDLRDTRYGRAHVSWTDPATGKSIEYTYKPRNTRKEWPTLEISERVETREDARLLAMKRLRHKNKDEFRASFSMPGDARMAAGITVLVEGFGAFSGKYFVAKATHSLGRSGYTTKIEMRRALEEY
jgi:phage protein D